MRLGLFGGTFDPIHLGHLILAEQLPRGVRARPGLVRGRRRAAAQAGRPDGGRRPPGDGPDRVAGHPAFEVSELETSRPGPHYSVETLEAVRRERPEDELFFLIGADSLADLPHWREPERIAAAGDGRRRQPPRGIDGPAAHTSLARPRPRARPFRLVKIPRSASPRTTSAGAWPRGAASATRSRAGRGLHRGPRSSTRSKRLAVRVAQGVGNDALRADELPGLRLNALLFSPTQLANPQALSSIWAHPRRGSGR